jgi:hypothetical protein
MAAHPKQACAHLLPVINGCSPPRPGTRGLILVTRSVADLARSDARVLDLFDPSGRGE